MEDTILVPSVNGGALLFGSGADPANGTVYVVGKDMPSILKLVPAGESTASNAGGLIPDRPRGGRGGRGAPPAVQATAERRGRAVYEQSCQICHGPDLKGERGPGLVDAASRLGADSIRSAIAKGKGAMPPLPSLAAPLVEDLIAFLK